MKNENYPNHKTYLSVASTKNLVVITQMINEQVLTLADILNEISTIEKKIQYLENIKVYEVQIHYSEINDRGFKNLPQSTIPFSFTVEVQKLISDSIKKHQTTILNLKELLNQQK